MTKIVFFVTPKSMVKIGTKFAEFVPILGPAASFSKKAKSASSRGIGILFDYCFGKAGAASVECALWITFSIAGGVTGNFVLIAGGAEFGNILMDGILD